MKTQLSLNGVDTKQLMRTVEDIKATPALAVFKFRAIELQNQKGD